VVSSKDAQIGAEILDFSIEFLAPDGTADNRWSRWIASGPQLPEMKFSTELFVYFSGILASG